jgi:hypothetical protein
MPHKVIILQGHKRPLLSRICWMMQPAGYWLEAQKSIGYERQPYWLDAARVR